MSPDPNSSKAGELCESSPELAVASFLFGVVGNVRDSGRPGGKRLVVRGSRTGEMSR